MPTTQEQFRQQLEKLVAKFQAHSSDYMAAGYSEADARAEFIDPLFIALGWDVRDDASLGPKNRQVLREQSEIAGKSDYAFRIGGQTKFFVEAKAPRVKLSAKDILQAKRYAWNTRDVSFAILTDFEEFRLYDASLKPDEKHPDLGLVFAYRCDEYLTDAALANLWKLSRDQVAAGSLDTLLRQDAASRRMRIPVDQSFLDDLTGWREQLAKDCFKHSHLDAPALNEAVQVFLDRLIFIRMVEDRRILEAESLGKLVEQWSQARHRSLRAMLDRLFVQVNDYLNGEVFKPNAALDQAVFDDALVAKIIRGLYDGPYDFAVIGVELLGSIYERYLGKTIRVTAARAIVEDKPEVRKAGGVYYTPKYIVDYIVDQTVGRLIEGKTPQQIAKMRILDPACGSGSFLLGAFQYLLDWHQRWYAGQGDKVTRRQGDKPAASSEQPIHQPRLIGEREGGEFKLSLAQKADILRNNIYGVDLDPQAVEITMMSLYIKMLEGERGAVAGRAVLPPLRNNIKCGNSLIGPDYFDGQLIADPAEQARVNPFDWEHEFPPPQPSPARGGGQGGGGFDAVIGNPPFLSSDNIPGDIKPYLAHAFTKVSQHRFDLACVFFEQSLRLLQSNGLLGLLQPSHILTGEYFTPARELMVSNCRLESVIDFKETAFGQVSNPICSIVATKQTVSESYIFAVKDVRSSQELSSLETWQKDIRTVINDRIVNAQGKSLQSYRIILSRVYDLMLKRTVGCIDLSSLGIVTDGIQTANLLHTIFTTEPKNSNDYIKALRSGKDIPGRYGYVQWGGWYVLKPELCTRYKRPGFNYGSERRLKVFHADQKIILRQTEPTIVATLDTEQFYSPNSIFHIKIADDNYDPRYILGLLNSTFLRTLYAEVTRKSGTTKPQIYLNPLKMLPIHPINFSDPADVARHDRMVTLVQQMLDLHKQLAAAAAPNIKTTLQRQIDAADQAIDQLVYELYGLTDQEIKIIEA